MSEKAPRPGRRQFWLAILGGMVIVVLTAGATTTLGLKKVDDELSPLIHPNPTAPKAIEPKGLTRAEAGKAQTFLILGSDKRYSEKEKDARSDTIMLLRLDPDQAATTMLSIPRDLKVNIPTRGLAKINEAYTIGGESLTLQTIKQLTGLEINHVVNVNFSGFRKAINELGCVYTDVDRKYYHSNVGLGIGERYAEIDIEPGYQRLCGSDALEYVRYRHTDSDLVRGARQQDFLRSMKDQVSASTLFNDRKKLLEIFSDNATVDKALRDRNQLLKVLKLALFSAGHPVRQVKFPGLFDKEVLPGGAEIDYVVASPESIARTIEEFKHPPQETAPKKTTTKGKKKKGSAATVVPGIVAARQQAQEAVDSTKDLDTLGFPLRFPSKLTELSRFPSQEPVRVYELKDRAGKPHMAYRVVVIANEQEGQYYGVQGTTWRNPPILAKPTSTREVHGRRLSLYRDGNRLRLVAWKTKSAVYWVSNTLSLKLTNAQMIEIAGTLAL